MINFTRLPVADCPNILISCESTTGSSLDSGEFESDSDGGLSDATAELRIITELASGSSDSSDGSEFESGYPDTSKLVLPEKSSLPENHCCQKNRWPKVNRCS
jgi:hypothetical protein